MQRRIPFVLVAGLVVLSACSEPRARAYTTQTATSHGTTTPMPDAPAQDAIAISGAGFHVHAAGAVGQASSDATWAGVLGTLNGYLDAAVLAPLLTGGPAGDLAPFFTPAAIGRVTGHGPDRGAFIDEGVPLVTGLRSEAATATLSALAGADGAPRVVAAELDLRLTGDVDGGTITVVRTGELVLVSDGGPWLIDAYDLRVTRTLPPERATTTTAVRL